MAKKKMLNLKRKGKAVSKPREEETKEPSITKAAQDPEELVELARSLGDGDGSDQALTKALIRGAIQSNKGWAAYGIRTEQAIDLLTEAGYSSLAELIQEEKEMAKKATDSGKGKGKGSGTKATTKAKSNTITIGEGKNKVSFREGSIKHQTYKLAKAGQTIKKIQESNPGDKRVHTHLREFIAAGLDYDYDANLTRKRNGAAKAKPKAKAKAKPKAKAKAKPKAKGKGKAKPTGLNLGKGKKKGKK